MRIVILLLAFLILPSCGLYRRTMESADKAAYLLDKAKELTATAVDIAGKAKSAVATLAQAKKDADTDGDGKTSMSEWGVWLAGGGAATLTAGFAQMQATRKRNAASDDRKSRTEAQVAEQAVQMKQIVEALAHIKAKVPA